MAYWNKDEFQKIADSDDLHVSPLRDDGVTFGTPTWIWSVVVDCALYVRAYNGKASRWYQAAIKQINERIRSAGVTRDVAFETVDDDMNAAIDEAYRIKYKGSRYLAPMVGAKTRAATLRIVPR